MPDPAPLRNSAAARLTKLHQWCRQGPRVETVDYIDLLEWPAMLVTVAAAWMIGSLRPRRRIVGFCLFLLSNLLWVIWGLPAGAWGLIVLQVCLAVMNIRGLLKNERTDAADLAGKGAR